jgi:hypothetical protein
MTDKQFALLIRQYAMRVQQGINMAAAELPEDAFKQGKNLLGQEFRYAPALQELESFAKELDDAANLLEKPST